MIDKDAIVKTFVDGVKDHSPLYGSNTDKSQVGGSIFKVDVDDDSVTFYAD